MKVSPRPTLPGQISRQPSHHPVSLRLTFTNRTAYNTVQYLKTSARIIHPNNNPKRYGFAHGSHTLYLEYSFSRTPNSPKNLVQKMTARYSIHFETFAVSGFLTTNCGESVASHTIRNGGITEQTKVYLDLTHVC